jgi:HAD superfamily hydrolase (TIGR01549 family)
VDERIRAVALDLFGTLVQWSPQRLPEMEIRGRRIHTTIPWLVPTLERGLGNAFRLEAFIEAYGDVLGEIEAERSSRGIEVTCHERFRRTLERLSPSRDTIDELAEELTRTHMAAVRSVTQAPAEYVSAVRRVARRYRMALVSNFDDARTGREIVTDTGVADRFEHVVISAEVDVRKPNPKIFAHLLERIRLSPEEVLFVGDTAHEDVAGARAAGLPVVWLSENKGEFPPDVAAPDYTIRNLTELPRLLGLE